MAGVSIKVSVDDRAAVQGLNAIARRLRDPRGMWSAIGESLRTSTDQRFAEGRAPSGSRWPPLRALADGGLTLVGRPPQLRSSIAYQSGPDYVEIGTNKHYAAIHQFGGTITAKSAKGLRWIYKGAGGKDAFARKQSVKIPARPFIGLDQHDDAEIPRTAEDWLRLEIDDAG